MTAHREAVGIDIGGTVIKAVLVNDAGQVERRLTAAADADRTRLVAGVRQVLTTLLADGRKAPLCLAMAGIPHPNGRSTQFCPGDKHDIEGLDWTEALDWSDDIPVLNDAQAALLGECWTGAARGRRDVVMLTLGTGVGGAVLADGRLLRGARGRAGHLGHLSVTDDPARGIVGTPGTLEDAIGEQTVTRRTGGRAATTADLVAAAERGEAWAEDVWMTSIRTLSRAIASIINAFDPEVVVLGGGIALAGPALFDPLEAALASDEWRLAGQAVPVIPALLGATAGAIGAAHHALVNTPPEYSEALPSD